MKTTIKIFVVRKDGEIIQAEGIVDGYSIVSPNIPRNDREKYIIHYEGEAKDLVGTYGPYTIEIIDKEIELN